MALNFTPHEKSVRAAEKALAMQIDVDALVQQVADERETYRRKTAFILERAEQTILNYGTDDSIDDEDLRRAQEMQKTFSDSPVDANFAERLEEIEKIRARLEGLFFSQMHQEIFKDIPKEEWSGPVHQIIQIATIQACAILEFNEDELYGMILGESQDIIRDRLGYGLL